MKADIALWAIVAVTQVLVGFLGILAIRSEFAAQHFKTFVASFIVLSLIGVVASGIAVVRAATASAKIEQLQADTLIAVQGSPDAFLDIHLVFTPGDSEEGIATFQFYNPTKFPMIDTNIWQSGGRYLDVTPEKYARNLGDIYAGAGGNLRGIQAKLRKDVAYNEVSFVVQSRSVTHWVDVIAKWNGKGWVIDHCIYKDGENGQTIYLRELREDTPKPAMYMPPNSIVVPESKWGPAP